MARGDDQPRNGGGSAPASAPGPRRPRIAPSARRAGSYAPAYIQIAESIGDRIATGVYRPGDQLPSESQFCAEFGVSPMTLRRALTMLVDRGLILTAQGRGTFVRSLELGEAAFRLEQLTQRWQDGASTVRLLEASIVEPEDEVREVLGLAFGERTVFLRRLFLRDGRPFLLQREHVLYDPRRPLVESQLQLTSLRGVLESGSAAGFARAELSIEAVNLDGEAAELLCLPLDAAAFCLEHRVQDFEGRVVGLGWFLFRSDDFRLFARLGPPAQGGW